MVKIKEASGTKTIFHIVFFGLLQPVWYDEEESEIFLYPIKFDEGKPRNNSFVV